MVEYKIYILFVSILFCFSCVGYEHEFPNHLYVDKDFTEKELIVIESAIAEWHYATNGFVRVTTHSIDPSPPKEIHGNSADEHILYKISYKDKIYKRIKRKINGHFYGWANTLDILVVPDRIDAKLAELKLNNIDHEFNYYYRLDRVVLHELGHHWGLRHPQTDQRSLMTPSGDIFCITHRDLEDFCSIHDCDAIKTRTTCSCEELKIKDTCRINPYKKYWREKLGY